MWTQICRRVINLGWCQGEDNPGRETSISNFQGGNVQNPTGKLVIITRATTGSKMRYKEMVATRTIKLFTEMWPLSWSEFVIRGINTCRYIFKFRKFSLHIYVKLSVYVGKYPSLIWVPLIIIYRSIIFDVTNLKIFYIIKEFPNTETMVSTPLSWENAF